MECLKKNQKLYFVLKIAIAQSILKILRSVFFCKPSHFDDKKEIYNKKYGL